MTRYFKPYSEYKDSGLPWLGKIPSHWTMLRGKYIFQYKKEINSSMSNTNILSLTLRGVVNNDPNDPEGLVPRNYATYQLFKKSDLVFKLIDLENLQTSRIGIVHEDGIMSPAYIRLVPRKGIIVRFFFYQYYDLYLRGVFNKLGSGVRATLGPSDLLNLANVIPPSEDQIKIVVFLDNQDRTVNRCIKTKLRLIELLNEQKKVIINRVITRGLNPNVQLKPSGIDWLGDIPEHWEVRPLKQIASVSLSGVDKHSFDGEIPIRLCNYTDVYNNDKITSDMDFLSATAKKSEVESFALQKGDVLITKDSEMWDDIAVPALVIQDMDGVLCGYHLALIRPYHQYVESEFLFRSFTAKNLTWQFYVAANGVTRYGLSKHSIKNAIILLPPVNEQLNICHWINNQLRPITASSERALKEINLIREYRTRLITDVVTGKIDVRNIQIPEEKITKAIDELVGTESIEETEMKNIEGKTDG